ncbi:hypothetical protein EASAB2608_02844 [Streptomyces sp. EAS-AB2608]|nr:hypothetical protein EASAB2608_02844 [Streptomyces sp. EAS-AB2608]
MIPLQHRTKGPRTLGATPERPIGPFGRWPDSSEDEETDSGADQAAHPTQPPTPGSPESSINASSA